MSGVSIVDLCEEIRLLGRKVDHLNKDLEDHKIVLESLAESNHRRLLEHKSMIETLKREFLLLREEALLC